MTRAGWSLLSSSAKFFLQQRNEISRKRTHLFQWVLHFQARWVPVFSSWMCSWLLCVSEAVVTVRITARGAFVLGYPEVSCFGFLGKTQFLFLKVEQEKILKALGVCRMRELLGRQL